MIPLPRPFDQLSKQNGDSPLLKLTHKVFAISFLLSILLPPFSAASAADFKREVVYQIITDRFFDGNTANNNPSQSAGLYDATKTNWRLYWGGDLQGIQQKMTYLAGMGITAIWISPPVDNLNTNIPDGNGNLTASYHGYQGRDFKRIEEHFGNLSSVSLSNTKVRATPQKKSHCPRLVSRATPHSG
ncbi:MAG TPA: hypothetical protein DHU55_16115 [Blastocatellia bacterium]|jgi:hypothetical protein|nr:hypothetical protein [Blastocatellia bacterium]